MKYLCLIYRDEAKRRTLSPGEYDAVVDEAREFGEELRQRGNCIAAACLQSEETATSIRVRNGQVTILDGPGEGFEERLAGFYFIEARDLNDAIRVATNLPEARLGRVDVRAIRQEQQADRQPRIKTETMTAPPEQRTWRSGARNGEDMVTLQPETSLQLAFSSPDATPTPWPEAERRLREAEVYWLSTVRPDGRPHVTPLIGIWHGGALHFTTGETERKTKNLAQNAHCVVTTGCNALNTGLDLVVEGDAEQVTDEPRLQLLAAQYAQKYEGWHFDVRDGAFDGEGGRSLVFAVAPVTVFGFGKGEPFSQTRWRFE